jgi:3-hydroxybutyrate dehydrogenase
MGSAGNGGTAKDVAEKIGREAMQADLSEYEVLDSLRVKADIVGNHAGLQHVAPIEDFSPSVSL